MNLYRRILALVLGQSLVALLFCWAPLLQSYSAVGWEWTGLLAALLALFFFVLGRLLKEPEWS